MFKNVKKTWCIFSELISWICLALMIICIAALVIVKLSGGVPQFLGYRIFVIATGSMSPELEVGDVILSKSFNAGDDLKERDILTYTGEGNMQGYLITHRLISIEGKPGNRILILQGDANNIADSPVEETRVVAKTVCKLRVFGAIYSLMQTSLGMPVLILLILFFIIKELLEFSKSLHNDREKEQLDNNISKK